MQEREKELKNEIATAQTQVYSYYHRGIYYVKKLWLSGINIKIKVQGRQNKKVEELTGFAPPFTSNDLLGKFVLDYYHSITQ